MVHFLVFVVFSAQSAIYGLLSNSYSYTVRYVSFTITGEPIVNTVAELQLSTLVAAYFAVAAFHHLLVVLPGVFPIYKSCLEHRSNPFRWLEYIVSATIMIVILALLLGIQDIVVIGLLAICMSSCNSLGFAFERSRSGTIGAYTHVLGWLPFAAVWGVLFLKFGEGNYDPAVGNFVGPFFYAMFLLFDAFGVTQLLQFFGAYQHYVSVEYTFVVLSVVTKSVMGAAAFIAILFI